MRHRGLLGVAALFAAEGAMIHLGRTYGSTAEERRRRLPGDELIGLPDVVTDHATTIDASPGAVWPWLLQVGWGRAGWYTARWVDRLLFPANGPSADRIVPELQHLEVGQFVPDGPPETGCGMLVEHLDPERTLVLRSTTHLPRRWRDRAAVDWTWAFSLTPLGDGDRTRFHFRSRWTTSPWWLTAAGWLVIVPADGLMSHDMLRGVRERAEGQAPSAVAPRG